MLLLPLLISTMNHSNDTWNAAGSACQLCGTEAKWLPFPLTNPRISHTVKKGGHAAGIMKCLTAGM